MTEEIPKKQRVYELQNQKFKEGKRFTKLAEKIRKEKLKESYKGRETLAREKYYLKKEKKRFKEKFERGARLKKNIDKLLNKQLINRRILKQERGTVVIPAYKEEPYRSIYFKDEMERAKKEMFFK